MPLAERTVHRTTADTVGRVFFYRIMEGLVGLGPPGTPAVAGIALRSIPAWPGASGDVTITTAGERNPSGFVFLRAASFHPLGRAGLPAFFVRLTGKYGICLIGRVLNICFDLFINALRQEGGCLSPVKNEMKRGLYGDKT